MRPTVFVGYDTTPGTPNGPDRIALEVSRVIKSGAVLPGATVVEQRIDPTLLAGHLTRQSAGHHRKSDYDRMFLFGPATAMAYGAYEARLVFQENPFERLSSFAYASNLEITDLADTLYLALRRARCVVQLGEHRTRSLEHLLSRNVVSLPFPAFGTRLRPGTPVTHLLAINHSLPSLQATSICQRLREQLDPLVVRMTPRLAQTPDCQEAMEAVEDCAGRALHLHLGAALNERCPFRLIDSWAAGVPVVQLLQTHPHCETMSLNGNPTNTPYVAHRRSGLLCESLEAAIAHIRHVLDDPVTMRALVRGGQDALDRGDFSAHALVRELAQ